MRTQLPAALCMLVGSIAGSVASSLATFLDTGCKTSSITIAGENGYPDGVCTNIREVADGSYQSFMFITLDDGCAPTVYQNDTTSDTCSGAAYLGYISKCYNTSWAYYSIDQCTPLASGSSVPSSSTTSDASSSNITISGGDIAGAVVGSVCGLGIIAAVCTYLFWFRPKQKDKERRERADAENRAAAGMVFRTDPSKAYEMHQQPPELYSPNVNTELPTESFSEAPGNEGGVEVDNDTYRAAELPGDHPYQSSHWR
ncbi:hypothetical protein VP1G_02670 [Cytospora mali]|uniref:Uncharacterized protein n=1 Tax=Cytospora mali TaxID=578113 RepID=A0A194UUE4_CYTMA|nr:hypothetical protein VP1G_02670 [Valsa mali var. pyri (nom. inval.)]